MLVVFAEMDSPISNRYEAPLRATTTGSKWTDRSSDAQSKWYVLVSFHSEAKVQINSNCTKVEVTF